MTILRDDNTWLCMICMMIDEHYYMLILFVKEIMCQTPFMVSNDDEDHYDAKVQGYAYT